MQPPEETLPFSCLKHYVVFHLLISSKKSVGVGPIVVSKAMMQLIAKYLVMEPKSEATELFETFQLGVGLSEGTVANFHCA